MKSRIRLKKDKSFPVMYVERRAASFTWLGQALVSWSSSEVAIGLELDPVR